MSEFVDSNLGFKSLLTLIILDICPPLSYLVGHPSPSVLYPVVLPIHLSCATSSLSVAYGPLLCTEHYMNGVTADIGDIARIGWPSSTVYYHIDSEGISRDRFLNVLYSLLFAFLLRTSQFSLFLRDLYIPCSPPGNEFDSITYFVLHLIFNIWDIKLFSLFHRAKEQAQRSSLIGTKSIEQRQKYMEVNDKYVQWRWKFVRTVTMKIRRHPWICLTYFLLLLGSKQNAKISF